MSQDDEGRPMGDEELDPETDGEYILGGHCPKCGAETTSGYGLACGPGIGAYEYCNECDWFQKWEDPT